MRKPAALAVAFVFILGACGDEPEPPAEPDGAARETPTEPENPETEMRLEGRLDGDPELEGGCVWLDADDDGRFEVLWPEGYDVAFDPVRLIGPDGETVATEGDAVTVEGRVAADKMSVCQVGTIFEASEVGETREGGQR